MRRTRQLVAVLRTLSDAPGPCHTRFGYDIIQETGLTRGAVYPILHRLEDAGWLESQEEPSPDKGRPSRRCYRFTELGRVEAQKIIQD